MLLPQKYEGSCCLACLRTILNALNPKFLESEKVMAKRLERITGRRREQILDRGIRNLMELVELANLYGLRAKRKNGTYASILKEIKQNNLIIARVRYRKFYNPNKKIVDEDPQEWDESVGHCVVLCKSQKEPFEVLDPYKRRITRDYAKSQGKRMIRNSTIFDWKSWRGSFVGIVPKG